MTLRREAETWLTRPVQDIDQTAVKALVTGIKARGAPEQRRVTLGMLKTLFASTVDCGDYGLTVSPAASLRPEVLIGKRVKRERVLKDYEIRAVWNAAGQLGYPFGSWVRFMFLTAVRRDEAAEMPWKELEAERWTIPGGPGGRHERGPDACRADDTGDCRDACELPAGRQGRFRLLNHEGRKPISSFSLAKTKFDALMKVSLAAEGKPFEAWHFHDIRRTCRTRFSELGIPWEIRELLFAHLPPQIVQTYDRHDYEKEKPDGLMKWHARLFGIVADNIVELPRKRA